jgi:hypothetical protein
LASLHFASARGEYCPVPVLQQAASAPLDDDTPLSEWFVEISLIFIDPEEEINGPWIPQQSWDMQVKLPQEGPYSERSILLGRI